jgi:hypothetical protein
MKRWAAIAAFLFLGAQFSAGLHAALEAGHDVHECCTDDVAAAHFDACAADHNAPACEVCAAAHSSVGSLPSVSEPAADLVAVAASPISESSVADPFGVEFPDSRAPPA